MSKKYRKVLSAILAATMVLGSTMVANAESQSATGDGHKDTVEQKEIFKVLLPTSAAKQFDYILDPNGVIAETEYAKYGGTASASFEKGQTMYFRNAPAVGATKVTYSSSSDAITAYNKSNIGVEIKVEVSIATPSGIELASARGDLVDSDTATPSIYMELVASGSTTQNPAITTAAKKAVATDSIPSAAANYKASYSNATKKYNYILATGADALATDSQRLSENFKSFTFKLTGACNTTEKWIGLSEQPPTVSLTWTIDPPADAAVSGPSLSMTTTGLISASGLTATQNFKSIKVVDGKNVEWDISDAPADWNVENWSAEEGGSFTIQLGEFWMNFIKENGGTAVVKLNLTDNSVKTISVTLP